MNEIPWVGLGSEYGPGSGVGSSVRSREWGIRVREEHVICRVVVGMGEWELDNGYGPKGG